jgi:hypothetical protein
MTRCVMCALDFAHTFVLNIPYFVCHTNSALSYEMKYFICLVTRLTYVIPPKPSQD